MNSILKKMSILLPLHKFKATGHFTTEISFYSLRYPNFSCGKRLANFRFVYTFNLLKWFNMTGHLEVERESGAVLCRIALWGCLGNVFWPSFPSNLVIANKRNHSVPKPYLWGHSAQYRPRRSRNPPPKVANSQSCSLCLSSSWLLEQDPGTVSRKSRKRFRVRSLLLS